MKKLISYQAGPDECMSTDIKTKYMTVNFVPRIEAIRDPIDIADARLTPDAAIAIMNLQSKGVIVRDSLDANRNARLLYNEEVIKHRDEKPEDVPLPFFDMVKFDEAIKEYIPKLDRNVVYSISGDLKVMLPLAVIIQLIAPSVKIDFGANLDKVYQKVHDKLFATNRYDVIKTTNDYYILWENSPVKFSTSVKDKKTPFFIYGVGDICWDDLFSSYYFLPAYFGEVNVCKDAKLSVFFAPLLKECIREIKNNKYSLYTFVKEAQNGLK